jgi:hypothetical protein
MRRYIVSFWSSRIIDDLILSVPAGHGHCCCIALPHASMRSPAICRTPQLGQKPQGMRLFAPGCTGLRADSRQSWTNLSLREELNQP